MWITDLQSVATSSLLQPLMYWLVSCILLQIVTFDHLVLGGIQTIKHGEYNLSDFENTVRFISHPEFNRKSKYQNKKKTEWKLQLGHSCLKMEIFCVFFETKADKKCSRGDILTIKTREKKMRFCGNKKPTKTKPLVFMENVSIVWSTDKTQTKRGFDCRIKCSEKVTLTSTTVSTTAATTKCKVTSGPGKGKPCVFPFTWQHTGITYDGFAHAPCPLVLY